MNRPRLEVCVEGVTGALAAQEGGGDRVELCAGLLEGGLTPSAATVRLARERLDIPIVVLVRPRGGDFLVRGVEREVLLADIAAARELGVFGVAVGALLPDGRIDVETMRACVETAGPLQVTCHRAFDMTRDPIEALDTLVEIGCDRVLTSGQEAAAPAAADLLAKLVRHAGDDIVVMPGAGIEPHQLAELARATGASEFHFAAMDSTESLMQFRNPRPFMGAVEVPGEYELRPTSPALVRRYVEALEP